MCLLLYVYVHIIILNVDALHSEMLVTKKPHTQFYFELEEIKLVVDLEIYPTLYTFLSLYLTTPISTT